MKEANKTIMNDLKIDAIMNMIAAMNLNGENIFKQTKELNLRLCSLEAKLQTSKAIHQSCQLIL